MNRTKTFEWVALAMLAPALLGCRGGGARQGDDDLAAAGGGAEPDTRAEGGRAAATAANGGGNGTADGYGGNGSPNDETAKEGQGGTGGGGGEGVAGQSMVKEPPGEPRDYTFTPEGHGAKTTGGEHGKIILVTSIDELVNAIQKTTGPRTIRFAKGGTYVQFGDIIIEGPDHGDLTVDGSTAPEPVILRGTTLLLRNTSNVIFRHLRLRTTRLNRDTVLFDGNVSDVVLDHMSFAWGGDDGIASLDYTPGRQVRITVQNSLVAEPFKCQKPGGGNCGWSFFANRSGTAAQWSFLNNLVITGENGAMIRVPESEWIGNVFANFVELPPTDPGADVIGNVFRTRGDKTISFGSNVVVSDNVGASGGRSADRSHDTPVLVRPASDTIKHVAHHVGATAPCRDGVDQGFVDQMVRGESPPIPETPPRWESLSLACVSQ